MSRAYNAYIRISNFDPARKLAIVTAARADWGWSFDGWNDPSFPNQEIIESAEDSYLSGGESEEEFVQRVTHDIWTANGAFCSVQLEMTFLENLPFETYELDEEDYAGWLASVEKTK